MNTDMDDFTEAEAEVVRPTEEDMDMAEDD
jgi:hypothetical protein